MVACNALPLECTLLKIVRRLHAKLLYILCTLSEMLPCNVNCGAEKHMRVFKKVSMVGMFSE
jgi:hypothetical protein